MELTDHIVVNDTSPQLTITVLDGGNHSYLISGFDTTSNPVGNPTQDQTNLRLCFQNGTEARNGITNEALLTILIHRLELFQKEKYPCIENELALEGLSKALFWLKERTRERIVRGESGWLQPRK